MDGNIYNYAHGSMWNGYSEGLQTPSFDLQQHMSTNREQIKNSWIPSAPHYLFINYTDQSSHLNHHHHQQHEHSHYHDESLERNQWHFPAWPKMKGRYEHVFEEPAKSCTEKQLVKDDAVEMAVAPQAATISICANRYDVFTSQSTSGQTTDAHKTGPSGSGHASLTAPMRVTSQVVSLDTGQKTGPSGSGHGSLTAPMRVTSQVVSLDTGQGGMSRKGHTSKKRREKSKEDQIVKKRSRDEDQWARNIRKKARSRGQSYVSVQGKMVPARSVKMVDCSKCKFNCPSRISEEERQILFQEYWALDSFKEKVDYIAKCVNEFTPLRPVTGRRAFSRRYMLKVDGKEQRVCKEFFVTTFDISESTIVTYMDKKRKEPEAISDLRGKQTPSNKTPETTIKLIREHILSRTGLQGDLVSTHKESVKKLYHHYQTECESEAVKPASISVYRKVYAAMHTDKCVAPVEIPPDSVLVRSDKKRSECGDSHTSVSEHAVKGEGSTPGTSHSPVTDSPTNSEPLVEVLVTTTTAAAPYPDTGVPLGSGLAAYTYHHQQSEPPLSAQKICSLNIPHMHHHHHIWQQQTPPHQLILERSALSSSYQVGPMCGGPVSSSTQQPGQVEPICGSAVSSSTQSGQMVSSHHNYCSTSYQHGQHFLHPSSSALSSSSFSYGTLQTSLPSAADVVVPAGSNRGTSSRGNLPVETSTSGGTKETSKNKGIRDKVDKSKEKKCKKEAKKRIRNEDCWGRNVRKRLRFCGQAYTSVGGKQVEAKFVREVDCTKCKFKCTSRISQEQRQALNQLYWNLDTYKKKIEFLTKYVATYTPKRKMTGRRVFSRKYTFDVQGKEERVCKDFFKATLHISESTIATALEKSRQGPDAVVDMRGKHTPVNKTTQETLENIREVIIYITGLRPNRPNNTSTLRPEFRDAHRLYQVYKYDSEKKGIKVASLGIFRNILVKEFGIKSLKSKKPEILDRMCTNKNVALSSQKHVPPPKQSWTARVSQPCPLTNKPPDPITFIPRTVFTEDSQLADFNIPDL